MRILLSGARGFIGSALSPRLQASGHDVIVLSRGDEAPGPRWDPGAGTIDLSGAGALDAVIHLAGEGIGNHRWSRAQRERILESRRDGTALLAGTLAKLDQPPTVLLSGSAIGFYGDRGSAPIDESAGPGTGFLPEVTKAWEAATAAATDAGIRVVHLRTGVVLSATGGALAKQLPLFRVGLGGRLGPGSQYVSWISLDDELAAIEFLLDAPLEGAVNLTAPHAVTNMVLTLALKRALRRPAFLAVPPFALKIALGTQMAEELVLGGANVVPRRLLDAGFTFRHREIGDAVDAALGGRR